MQYLTFFLLHRRNAIDRLLASIFLLSICAFLFTGRSDQSYGDYVPVYGSARAAVMGVDPYKLENLKTELAAGGADMASYADADFWPMHPSVYPPITYYVLSPVSVLKFSLARNVWFAVLALAFIAGGAMTVHSSPLACNRFVLCGVSLVVASSGVLLRLGQLSGVAIGLSAAATMLFIGRRRLVAASCVFFAAAALKPQLALPLLAYFLLPRKTRKFALYTLGAFFVSLGLSCFMLTLIPAAAHWPSELAASLHTSSINGIPTEKFETGIVSPQAIFVLLSSNPRVYGMFTAVLVGIVVLVLVIGLRRLGGSPARDWLAVAAISIVTLLLTYHRTYDMRMVMLTLPALALLWRVVPRVAALLTFLSCFLLFSTAILLVHVLNPHLSHATTHGFIFRLLVERQQALFVLLTALAWIVVLFMADGFRITAESVQPDSGTLDAPSLLRD